MVIGSLTDDNTGSIPTIALAFLTGLGERYDFRPHYARRSFGLTRTSRFNLLNLYYLLKHLVLWVALLLRHRPDIVHYPVTSGWNLEKSMVFLHVSRLLGAKTVGHLNGGAFTTFWDRIPPWRRACCRWWLRRLDVFLVTSGGWRAWSADVAGLDAHRVATVVNPIDPEFERAALSFLPSSSPDFFFVGAIGQRKGVFDILKVAGELQAHGNGDRIHIAGPEDRAGDLRKVRGLLDERRLRNVNLCGPLYGHEKIDFFRDHGIFLFPSYNENFPLVVIEAAAAGKPIITTPAGALPEFFRDGESLLFVRPGNVEDIIAAMERLRSDSTLRTTIGEGARAVFLARLSRPHVLESLDTVYQNLLELPGGADGVAR